MQKSVNVAPAQELTQTEDEQREQVVTRACDVIRDNYVSE